MCPPPLPVLFVLFVLWLLRRAADCPATGDGEGPAEPTDVTATTGAALGSAGEFPSGPPGAGLPGADSEPELDSFAASSIAG